MRFSHMLLAFRLISSRSNSATWESDGALPRRFFKATLKELVSNMSVHLVKLFSANPKKLEGWRAAATSATILVFHPMLASVFIQSSNGLVSSSMALLCAELTLGKFCGGVTHSNPTPSQILSSELHSTILRRYIFRGLYE